MLLKLLILYSGCILKSSNIILVTHKLSINFLFILTGKNVSYRYLISLIAWSIMFCHFPIWGFKIMTQIFVPDSVHLSVEWPCLVGNLSAPHLTFHSILLLLLQYSIANNRPNNRKEKEREKTKTRPTEDKLNDVKKYPPMPNWTNILTSFQRFLVSAI